MRQDRTVIITIKGNTVRIDDPDFAVGMREEYEKYQQDLIDEWRNGPTALIDIPMSEEEKGDLAYYNALAANILDPSKLSADGRYYDGIPIGKVVI